jgi:hypothetical protein
MLRQHRHSSCGGAFTSFGQACSHWMQQLPRALGIWFFSVDDCPIHTCQGMIHALTRLTPNLDIHIVPYSLHPCRAADAKKSSSSEGLLQHTAWYLWMQC